MFIHVFEVKLQCCGPEETCRIKVSHVVQGHCCCRFWGYLHVSLGVYWSSWTTMLVRRGTRCLSIWAQRAAARLGAMSPPMQVCMLMPKHIKQRAEWLACILQSQAHSALAPSRMKGKQHQCWRHYVTYQSCSGSLSTCLAQCQFQVSTLSRINCQQHNGKTACCQQCVDSSFRNGHRRSASKQWP